jgi:hypothetical protein
MRLLDHFVPDKRASSAPKSLLNHIIKIAGSGAIWLARAILPRGNIVMWRGLSRLTNIQLGAHLAPDLVGN